MNKPHRVYLNALFIGLLACGAPALADEIATPAVTYPGQIGLYKAGKMSKASSSLVRVVQEHRAHNRQAQTAAFRPSDQFLRYHAGRVLIDATAFGDGAALLQDLKRLGLINGAHFGNAVSGMLPVAAIEKAVALDLLRSISASLNPINNTGSITSQGDVALRADVARSSYAVDGTGVTVGVLSDSFNSLGGAAQDISTGDLPASGVTVVGGESPYCGTVIFCIDEGRAMLQIVHDMAPGADLLFHQALDGKAAYAAAILRLATLGADVIVDDLLYLNEPMFQDGVVAQAVDSVVAGGSAYYSAAGNAGRESYEAPFADSGVIFCIEFFLPIGDCDPIYERVGRMHDFDPGVGVDLYQRVTVPIGTRLIVAMQWDAPFGGAGPKNDHDIVLLDETGGYYFEISANDNVTMGEGWEVLQFDNHEVLGWGSVFNIIITYDDVDSNGPPAGLLKTVVFGSSTLNDFATNSGTLIGHANAAGAAAVGAVFFEDTPEFGTPIPVLESYSSAGGVPILFGANGSLLASPEVRLKPDITAVDGVNTTFFFNDSYGDSADDFFGTSAAAPHAAGIAALMLQEKPGATPAQLNAALQQSAIDMGAAGFDFDSGYGLIQADAAIDQLSAVSSNAPPVAVFIHSCDLLLCTFNGSDSSDDVGITSYTWDFGDGSGPSSLLESTTHSYAAAGNYLVTLLVTDAELASDTASATISVEADSGGETNFKPEKGRKKCNDGIDNDGDGLTDGADPDCSR